MSLGFQIFEIDLVAPATNALSDPFPWLVLNRSCKASLALPCIRVVLCRTADVYFPKLLIEIPQKKCLSRKLLTLIIIIIIVIRHLSTVYKKRFHLTWTEKAN